ncbi:MAG TPA: gamma-glutamyl-gamma-aminobutyrate hydrolase family protein [Thermoleophilaceae bacterium]|nr:gamma-glutamyl-gamma-aminobutyrate hydrolase family protein [Thermoleophilaceae bacterium]
MPVVGLIAETGRTRHGDAWDEDCDYLPRAYSLAVERAGAVALLLPSSDVVAREPDVVLDLVDALVLSGGCDIDPVSYGARQSERTGPTRPERDRFELALAHRSLERDLPLLGICRGMEMLNVASGGTLTQHLPDALGSDRHAHTPGAFADHEVELEPASLAARAAGAGRIAVKSHHHQGVAELGEGLVVSGRAVEDGLAEAIELPDRNFALGVLWHPEEDEADRIIGSLVEAATA